MYTSLLCSHGQYRAGADPLYAMVFVKVFEILFHSMTCFLFNEKSVDHKYKNGNLK